MPANILSAPVASGLQAPSLALDTPCLLPPRAPLLLSLCLEVAWVAHGALLGTPTVCTQAGHRGSSSPLQSFLTGTLLVSLSWTQLLPSVTACTECTGPHLLIEVPVLLLGQRMQQGCFPHSISFTPESVGSFH